MAAARSQRAFPPNLNPLLGERRFCTSPGPRAMGGYSRNLLALADSGFSWWRLGPPLPHALRHEDDGDGKGNGHDYKPEADDDGPWPQPKYRVDLVFDPLEEDRVAGLADVRQNEE